MRLLIQRVSEASVTIAGEIVARIGTGMLILVGVGHQDTINSHTKADYSVNKENINYVLMFYITIII